MDWRKWFGKPGVGQPRDPEASDIRDPGLDKAIADQRSEDLKRGIALLKEAGLWADNSLDKAS